MNIRDFLRKPLAYYLIWILVMGLLTTLIFLLKAGAAWLLLGMIPLLLFVCRPDSQLHSTPTSKKSLMWQILTILVMVLTIAACILPMDQLPIWNGELPAHRNQYELMAENLLEGRLYIKYGDEDLLRGLRNPYDPELRKSAGVPYHWDHAYYNGHYYMYFGIVPVLLVFLPYRLLSGHSLTTYHATQLFVATAIIGIFSLFHLLAKRFFPKLPRGITLAAAVAVSVMSVWYSTAEPALYCTAITAGISLEIWSLYCFFRAVWIEKAENRQILWAGIGALLGALVFGCRPTIALANIIVLPMLFVFLRQRKFTRKLLGKLVLAALPYAVVAAGLMLYNYARFDDPFEFGQAYQLTVADQSNYAVVLNRQTIVKLWNGLGENFFDIPKLSAAFPYVNLGGAFINFPMLFVVFFCFQPTVRLRMKQKQLTGTFTFFLISTVIITCMDILWTPYLLERYRMDIYFLLGIAAFLVIGFLHSVSSQPAQKKLNTAVMVFSVITVLSCALFCLRRVNVYYEDKVQQIAQFWVG